MYRLRLIPTISNYSMSPIGSAYSNIDESVPSPFFAKAKENNSIIASISFILNSSEYTYFMAFFRTGTNFGSSPFQIKLIYDSSTPNTYTAFFIPNTIEVHYDGNSIYEVSSQVEFCPILVSKTTDTENFNTYREKYV